MNFSTLRDRLLLRLLSARTREALHTVVFYDINEEIKDYSCTSPEERSSGFGHVAVGLTHLADLIDDTPVPRTDGITTWDSSWTARLTEFDA